MELPIAEEQQEIGEVITYPHASDWSLAVLFATRLKTA